MQPGVCRNSNVGCGGRAQILITTVLNAELLANWLIAIGHVVRS